MQTFLGSSYDNVHTLCVYIHRNITVSIFIFFPGSGILFLSSFITYVHLFSLHKVYQQIFFKQMLYLRILCRSKKKQIFFYLKKKSYGWGIKLQSLIASVFVICSCMCICSHLLDLVVYIPDKRNIYRHTNINASSFEHCHVFLMGVDVRACIASFNQN